jgi:hypothetical protein
MELEVRPSMKNSDNSVSTQQESESETAHFLSWDIEIRASLLDPSVPAPFRSRSQPRGIIPFLLPLAYLSRGHSAGIGAESFTLCVSSRHK